MGMNLSKLRKRTFSRLCVTQTIRTNINNDRSTGIGILQSVENDAYTFVLSIQFGPSAKLKDRE